MYYIIFGIAIFTHLICSPVAFASFVLYICVIVLKTVFLSNPTAVTPTIDCFHGTIIRTGITCRKSLVICATQLAGGLLLKKLKYLKVMLNIFEFSRVWEIVESWLVYANKLFLNCPTMFLDWHIKTKLVPASFSCFQDF